MYRAKAITQRDGSPLASSNCRMASIATGIDFDTVGAKTSTGAKMRAAQPDQSGGTDSGDAVIAWQKHGEVLAVRDGRTFDDALRDLKAGHLVHLDVWHATAGGPCLSGTGRYGHTIVVAPEKDGANWLVADPWCLPARWEWWPESKLRAGAEKWGGMVYNKVGTGGGSLRDAVLYLLSLGNPDRPATEDPDDTGGAGRILYTRTAAHPDEDDDVGIAFNITSPKVGVATLTKDVSLIATTDGRFHPMKKGATRNVFALTTITSGSYMGSNAYLTTYGNESWLLLASAASYVPSTTPPDPGPAPDCAEQVAAALELRDEQWRKWALAGAPGEEPS
jgi:hypothetical protein